MWDSKYTAVPVFIVVNVTQQCGSLMFFNNFWTKMNENEPFSVKASFLEWNVRLNGQIVHSTLHAVLTFTRRSRTHVATRQQIVPVM